MLWIRVTTTSMPVVTFTGDAYDDTDNSLIKSVYVDIKNGETTVKFKTAASATASADSNYTDLIFSVSNDGMRTWTLTGITGNVNVTIK